jgi:hypothetical protein
VSLTPFVLSPLRNLQLEGVMETIEDRADALSCGKQSLSLGSQEKWFR